MTTNKAKATARQRDDSEGKRKILQIPKLPTTWTPPQALRGWFDDNAPIEAPDWLVHKMIPRVGVGTGAAKWGEGKTYVFVDLSLSVASGRDFAGRRVNGPAGVIYIAPERPQSIKPRFRAARDAAGITEPLPLYIASACPRLSDEDAAPQLIDAIESIKIAFRFEFGLPTALVVYDTLARSAQWDDENSNAGAVHVYNVLSEVAAATHTFQFAIDHEGHTTGHTRGASAKEDCSDVLLRIANGTMKLAKLSYGEQDIDFGFRLVEREVGKDREGEAITECIVEWRSEAKSRREKKKPTGSYAVALKALRSMIAKHDAAVSEDVWRDEAYSVGISTGATTRAKQAAFRRAVDWLIENEWVVKDGELYEPAEERDRT